MAIPLWILGRVPHPAANDVVAITLKHVRPKPSFSHRQGHPRALATARFAFRGPIRWKMTAGSLALAPRDYQVLRALVPVKGKKQQRRANHRAFWLRVVDTEKGTM